MAYEFAPFPQQIQIPRYDFSGFAQAGSDIADIFVQRRKDQATQSAIQQLTGAQTPEQKQSALAQLMSVNPTVGAVYLRQELTPAERMAHEDRMAILGEREKEFGERRDAAIAAADAKADLASRKLKISQATAKAEAGGKLDVSNLQFDTFKQTAKELLEDPALDYSVGRYNNAANRATAKYLNPSVQDWWTKFESLQSQAKQAVTSLMKNEKGQTGMGRILLQEWNNFGQTLAPLSLNSDPKQMRQALKQVITFIDRSKKIVGDKYDQEYGDAPTEQAIAPGVTTTRPTGLPETAPPSAGDVPVQGAATETADPRGTPTPENIAATRAADTARIQKLKDAPDGKTAGGGRFVKRSGQWWDTQTNQRVKLY